ncbi:MAG: hypothetical protein NVSMB42_05460 [Herpetosiphon sp.]
MPEPTELRGLREQGFRLTHQRKLILEFIKTEARHVSAEEIYAAVSRNCPEMNITTVYRNIQWLQNIGLVRRLDGGKDPVHYEYAASQHHHHLICKTCGADQQIDDQLFAAFRAHMFAQYGFAADAGPLAISGRCNTCCTATTDDDNPQSQPPTGDTAHECS